MSMNLILSSFTSLPFGHAKHINSEMSTYDAERILIVQ